VLDLYGHFEGDAVESRVTARDGYRRILHDNQKDPFDAAFNQKNRALLLQQAISEFARRIRASTISLARR
jgi:hypothetical protein